MARIGTLALAALSAAFWTSIAGAADTSAASKDPSAGPGPCARIRCAAGTRCVNSADNKTGKCEKISKIVKPIKIHLAKCDPGCASTERCVWKQVVCIKAPCPPVAACVAKKDSESCETTKCAEGQTCVLQLSNPPKAACIDSSSLPGTK